MAILRRSMTYTPLDAATLQRWKAVPPAVAGDCMNRDRCMDSTVSPLGEGMVMVGHARTVSVMAGDNSAVHAVLPLLQPGEVLVITAGGAGEVAIIGEIIAECAMARGCAGIVLDGAVRDVGSLRAMSMPIYATGATPRGPHKGFGGEIDAPIACGGVVVEPGDLVLGDDDGICVVPATRLAEVLVQGEAQVAKEADIIAKVRSGVTTAELSGMAVPEPTDAAG